MSSFHKRNPKIILREPQVSSAIILNSFRHDSVKKLFDSLVLAKEQQELVERELFIVYET
jgi:hypothetical protein